MTAHKKNRTEWMGGKSEEDFKSSVEKERIAAQIYSTISQYDLSLCVHALGLVFARIINEGAESGKINSGIVMSLVFRAIEEEIYRLNEKLNPATFERR